jgi:hypothetical protein
MKAALDLANASEAPNLADIAREKKIVRSTLSRRYNGVTNSIEEAHEKQQLLSPLQDKWLLDLVKRLTKQGLPPSPKMVRQFAKDISNNTPGKNWSFRWLSRHSDELSARHLKGFDLARQKADNLWQYTAYFDLVIDVGTSKFSY